VNVLRLPVRIGLRIWKDERLLAVTRLLLLAAVALLGLSAAGTVEITFTLQPSYALLGLAALCGMPWAVEGWLRLPRTLRLAAATLVVVYVVAMLTGSPARLASQGRGGTLRPLVYIADLGLGLATVGLLCGVWSEAFGRRLLISFCTGAAITTTFAVYQWFALRFSLPLSDVNNALNSDGFTTGHRFQGAGLLGWERTRGTFKEPLVLGLFCVMALPLALRAVTSVRRRWRAGIVAIVIVVACALVLTVSSLSIGILIATGAVVTLIVTVRDGHVRVSGTLGAIVVLGLVAGPALLSNPSALSGLTGRSGHDLKLTADNRKVAWRDAVRRWEEQPILGYGPGQSSVRLAYRPDPLAVNRTYAPVVLGSAQGIWAASLIDAGIFGFCAWAALYLAVLSFGARAVWRDRGPRLALIFWAAAAGVVGSEFTGDRVDFRVWLALGALAAASEFYAGESGHGHRKSYEATDEGPAQRVGREFAHR